MAERFQIESGISSAKIDPNYNAAPGQFLPVVVRGEKGNELQVMKWGVVPRWAKDIKIGYKLINARAESLFEKPMWKPLITRQRALVPANGFYEWQRSDDGKTKTPFYIHPKDQELYSFAGIWETWHDIEGHPLQSFSIITTEPNKEMRDIHNRMPVILTPDEEGQWLDPAVIDRADIEPFLHPYHDGGLEIYEVTDEVNTPKNNAAYLIKPVYG